MVDRGTFNNMWENKLSFVNERVRACAPIKEQVHLPEDFEPAPWTVLCGRGKSCFNHVGNKRLRLLCHINLDKYEASQTKMEKSVIVMSIVDAVREASGIRGIGFVKQDRKTKQWVDVGDDAAREKVGQILRELMVRKDPAKAIKRKEQSSDAKNVSFEEEDDEIACLMTAPISRAESADLRKTIEAKAVITLPMDRKESVAVRGSVSVSSEASPVGALDGDSFFSKNAFFAEV